LPEVFDQLPKPPDGEMPYVEGLFYLLLTGDIPNEEEMNEILDEFRRRRILPRYVYEVIDGFPSQSHPMTIFSSAILSLHRESFFDRKYHAGISKIEIERSSRRIRLRIFTSRPGIVIGKKGEDIEKLRHEVARLMDLNVNNVKINIEEIRKPEIDATLVAESIAQQLERRIMFRRAMKRAVGNAMRLGALGIKVYVSGRLNGAEIARSEWYREGRVPLHTLRADIDYGTARANTTYGVIGVKVWIYKGEVFDLEAKSAGSKSTQEGK
jgi:small subunit ribosomal protein S3